MEERKKERREGYIFVGRAVAWSVGISFWCEGWEGGGEDLGKMQGEGCSTGDIWGEWCGRGMWNAFWGGLAAMYRCR